MIAASGLNGGLVDVFGLIGGFVSAAGDFFPFDLHARGFEDATSRASDLRADAFAGNKSNWMFHVRILFYGKHLWLSKTQRVSVSRQEHGRYRGVDEFCYTKGEDSEAGVPATRRLKEFMINLTSVASSKVKEIMNMQNPVPVALRVAVVGGGCSGFQYHMAFENNTSEADQIYEFDGLKVAVDQMSSMYLDGVEIDYIETLEGAGFKFNNPNVKSTCGCGSSFSV